ncbi:AMP-binding protein [Aurantibacter crassamenti]|uniref:AMP-binding protein n=1 Tax=Aurantibacter crassamenti TaxID=1837375 RepID=UPI0019396772|nr:AMP-binding protein [Aurantibacter crassamenti]MBM1107413.1 AMP-binding protein [Aurantibacter crassamenti]
MEKYKTLHNHFKFNGSSYTIEELQSLSRDYVKKGATNERSIGEFLLNWLDENETVKVSTSGSTGKPKEVELYKSKMVNSALATGEYFKLKPKDSALLCLSADYIAGKMMLVRAMVLGLELDCVSPSSDPLNVTNGKHYDFCAMVPMQLQNSINTINQINTLIVGGAAVSQVLKNKIQNTSCHIYETYGMTETITHVAIKKINNINFNLGVTDATYKALPNIAFSIDERNCLVINAPKVSDEVVVTNDVVNLISEIEFEWLGRFDSIINSGGVKLIPEQIESKLTPIITNRFFVAGLLDEKLGQKLVLIVEGEISAPTLMTEISQLSSISKYEKPKEVYSLPIFIETKTGKIQRKETIELLNL